MSEHHSDEIDLFKAIALIETAEEAKNFLTDLCTPSELKAFVERWRVCRLLDGRNLSYREIREQTGASLTTIGRVARFLNDEPYGGYKKILEEIKKTENENENDGDDSVRYCIWDPAERD
ncbi:MAG: trp operon repressor [Holosporaceae bacterium]|jgi:TrpR-related protein YerC/YecD|nr:trp operon repressor [Holosporaceae bacterium]